MLDIVRVHGTHVMMISTEVLDISLNFTLISVYC